MVAPVVMVTLVMESHIFFLDLLGLWTWFWRSRFILHNFYFFLILRGLIPPALRCSASPLGAGLLWLFISYITIEIAMYLLPRELEVDLPWFDADDCVCSVKEGSSKDDWYIFFFFFSHVWNHEVGRDIVILYSYRNVFCYSFQKLDWLVHHLQLHICREQRFVTK